MVRVETKPESRMNFLGDIILPQYIYLLKEDINWISDTEHKLKTSLSPHLAGYKYYRMREKMKESDTAESCSMEIVVNHYISPNDLIINSVKGEFLI